MASDSKIGWTRSTYSGWRGCTNIDYPGELDSACDLCYAETMCVNPLFGELTGGQWGKGTPRKQASEKYKNDPQRWARQRRKELAEGNTFPWHVFAFSMSDWADTEVEDRWRDEFFYEVVGPTLDDLVWILLTKRHAKARSYLPKLRGWPWKNVIVGMTMEHQAAFDLRIDALCDIDAYAYMISMEPLLGRIAIPDRYASKRLWGIIGGESGFTTNSESEGAKRQRRPVQPMHTGWAREQRDWFSGHGLPYFFKQHGNYIPHPFAFNGYGVNGLTGGLLKTEDLIRSVSVRYDGSFTEERISEDHLLMAEFGKQRLDKAHVNHILDGRAWYQWPDLGPDGTQLTGILDRSEEMFPEGATVSTMLTRKRRR